MHRNAQKKNIAKRQLTTYNSIKRSEAKCSASECRSGGFLQVVQNTLLFSLKNYVHQGFSYYGKYKFRVSISATKALPEHKGLAKPSFLYSPNVSAYAQYKSSA
jgi:hypothetical protein